MQPSLFDQQLARPDRNTPGRVHRRSHATEREAARLVTPRTGTQRSQVLAAIRGAGAAGLTHEEIVRQVRKVNVAVSESGVRTRTRELADGGWVRPNGNTRRTTRGLNALVWVLTPEALTLV